MDTQKWMAQGGRISKTDRRTDAALWNNGTSLVVERSRRREICRILRFTRKGQILSLSLEEKAMTINIEWQDQHGNWHHYQTKQNQSDAYRVAQRRAESTGMRHRLVDSN